MRGKKKAKRRKMLEFEPGMQYTDKEKEEGGFLEMFETLSAGALAYVQQNQERLIELIEELTAIPAPSHHEEKRAAFIRDWLTKRELAASSLTRRSMWCFR